MTETTAEGTTGSPLRQRMIDQMRIANFAESTQTIYIGEIAQLAKHYKASPADLDADQVRAWVLSGIDRGLKPATTNVTVAALKFFYAETLGCPERVAGLRARKKPRKLPRHMEEEEVERIILANARPPVPRRHRHRLRCRASHLRDRGHQDRRHQVGPEAATHPFRQGRTERMAPIPEAVIHYLRGFYKNIWPQPVTWLFYGASPDVPIRTGDLHVAFKKGARAGRRRQPPHLPLPASFGRHPSSMSGAATWR